MAAASSTECAGSAHTVFPVAMMEPSNTASHRARQILTFLICSAFMCNLVEAELRGAPTVSAESSMVLANGEGEAGVVLPPARSPFSHPTANKHFFLFALEVVAAASLAVALLLMRCYRATRPDAAESPKARRLSALLAFFCIVSDKEAAPHPPTANTQQRVCFEPTHRSERSGKAVSSRAVDRALKSCKQTAAQQRLSGKSRTVLRGCGCGEMLGPSESGDEEEGASSLRFQNWKTASREKDGTLWLMGLSLEAAEVTLKVFLQWPFWCTQGVPALGVDWLAGGIAALNKGVGLASRGRNSTAAGPHRGDLARVNLVTMDACNLVACQPSLLLSYLEQRSLQISPV
ncbi:hypothetical protein Efla_004963 [Eimeria flavescens]